MQKKYLPERASRKRCFLLLVIFICLYLIDNSPIPSTIGFKLYGNLLKPVLWIGLAFIIWNFARVRPAAKLKFRGSFIQWAFIFAVIYVLVSIGAGLLDGFGKSPYNHSLKGMLQNIFLVGSVLVGREVLRSYIVNSFVKKENFLIFLLVSLITTVCDFTIQKYTSLKGLESTVQFIAQYFAPTFSQNLLATYLSFLGGPVPAIIYMGILQAFHWLSPILPNLKWITTALIGILCPVFSLMIIQNIYLKEAKLLKSRDKDDESPVGWIITSLVSISIIWFSVGVFPVYPSVIATGSMEPMIKPGDVVLIDKSVNKENLSIGDVIQFKRDTILISHRIIEVIEAVEGKGYQTKGDNNSAKDYDIVRIHQVKGKIVKVVPKIGWPTLLIKNEKDIPLDQIEF